MCPIVVQIGTPLQTSPPGCGDPSRHPEGRSPSKVHGHNTATYSAGGGRRTPDAKSIRSVGTAPRSPGDPPFRREPPGHEQYYADFSSAARSGREDGEVIEPDAATARRRPQSRLRHRSRRAGDRAGCSQCSRLDRPFQHVQSKNITVVVDRPLQVDIAGARHHTSGIGQSESWRRDTIRSLKPPQAGLFFKRS